MKNGYSKFWSDFRSEFREGWNDPWGKWKQNMIERGAWKNIIPGYTAYQVSVGTQIHNYQTASAGVSHLYNGNYYEAGQVYGYAQGEGHLQLGLMAMTAGIAKGVPVARGAFRRGLSNPQLVQKSATLAERAIGGTGRFAGTAKHTYANNLLNRYQSIHGDRGLRFNHFFDNNTTLGQGNRGFLDVIDNQNIRIYDFKYGNATWRPGQLQKYQRNFPNHSIEIIRP